jgi:hypothetical protein
MTRLEKETLVRQLQILLRDSSTRESPSALLLSQSDECALECTAPLKTKHHAATFHKIGRLPWYAPHTTRLPKIKMQNVTSSSLSTSQKRKEINRRRERNMCTWNVHDELVVTSLSLASGSATVISSRSRGSMSPFFCFAVGFFTYVLLFVLLLFFKILYILL